MAFWSRREDAMPKRASVEEGFTLIELLIVIAIIAILAAILFPVFATAREKARQVTCQNNLKQIGTAFSMYAQDFDETYPWNITGGSPYTGWDTEISPYAGLNAVSVNTKNTTNGVPISPFWTCPDDQVARYNNQDPTAKCNARSYAEAAEVVDGGFAHRCWGSISDGTPCYNALSNGGKLYPGRSVSELPAPANTFMVAEWPNNAALLGTSNQFAVYAPNNQYSSTGGLNNYSTQDCVGNPTTLNPYCSAASDIGKPLHSGGWNYLYCDGHVKWLRPDQTFGKPGKHPVGHTLNNWNTTVTCNGTATSPCGPWTVDDDDN